MRKTIFSFIFFLYILSLSAQQFDGDLPSVFPPSPEVAAFGNVIDTPVSYATGVPNISIPILELSGKVTIPVSISYHAGGIKVGSFSSRVGLGWNLNAGGRITRSVRGGADDGGDGSFFGFISPNVTTIQQIIDSNDKQALINQNSSHDFQSDVYNYSFLGQSGSFFLEQVLNSSIPGFPVSIIQNPKTDNLIEPILENGKLEGWTITTPDGTKYDFGKSKIDGRKAVDISRTLSKDNYQSNSNPYSYNESWELMDIQTKDNDTTSFFYTSKEIKFLTLTGQQYIFSLNQPLSLQFSENNNTSHYLIEVRNSMGKVVLNYNHNRKDIIGDVSLTAIKLYNKNDLLIDSYSLFQNYFQSNGIDNQLIDIIPGVDYIGQRTKRLRLDRVTQTINNQSNKSYSFSYNVEKTLPDRLSFSQDYWGFYNGKSNSYFIPKVQFRYNGIIIKSPVGGDRSVSFLETQAGTLSKIEYPSGGFTEYKYELNRVDSMEAPLALSFNAYDSEPVLENFEINPLNNDQYSSIIDFDPLVYTGGFFIDISGVAGCGNSGQSGCPSVEVIAINSDTQNSESLFTYFGVADSKNTFPLSSGFNQIKVIYSWPDMPENSAPLMLNIKGYKKPLLGFKVGGLRVKNISSYSKEGVLAKSEDIQYTQFRNNKKSSGIGTVPPVFVQEDGFMQLDATTDQFVGYTTLTTNVLLPLNNYGSDVTYTEVTSKLSGDNLGKIEKTFSEPPIVDPLNYIAGIYLCQVSCLNSSIPRRDYSHRQGLLKNEKVYSQNGVNNFSLVKETINEYDSPADNHFSPNMVFKEYFFQLNFEVVYEFYDAVSERQYLKKQTNIEHFSSDSLVDITEYFYDTGYLGRMIPTSTIKTTSNDNQLIKTEIDYPQDRPAGEPYMTQLIAAHRIAEPIEERKILVKNSIETLLQTTRTRYGIFNGLYLPKVIQTAKGTESLRNRLLYHSYDGYGNLREVSQPNGVMTVYVMGYDFTLPVAKLENVSLSEINQSWLNLIYNAPNEEDLITALTNLRSHITNLNKAALVTTYTYKPLVGISTITDPKGYKITYVYDDFGRLKYVEDMQGNVLSENQYHYKNDH